MVYSVLSIHHHAVSTPNIRGTITIKMKSQSPYTFKTDVIDLLWWQDKDGFTALSHATKRGHRDVVDVLTSESNSTSCIHMSVLRFVMGLWLQAVHCV
jgi:hypothetical protein